MFILETQISLEYTFLLLFLLFIFLIRFYQTELIWIYYAKDDFFTWIHQQAMKSNHLPYLKVKFLNRKLYWITDHQLAKSIFDNFNGYKENSLFERAQEFREPHIFIFGGDNIGNTVHHEWKWRRKIISKWFTPAKVSSVQPFLIEQVEKLVKGLGNVSGQDFVSQINKLTLRATVDLVLDIKMSPEQEEIYLRDFGHQTGYFDYLPRLLPFGLGKLCSRMFVEAKERIHQVTRELIQQHDGLGQDQLSFIKDYREYSKKNGISEESLVTEVGAIAYGSHDTTNQAISLVLYMLSKHPEIQKKLRQEFQSENEKATVIQQQEEISSLSTYVNENPKSSSEKGLNKQYQKYLSNILLHAVIQETIRLYPIGVVSLMNFIGGEGKDSVEFSGIDFEPESLVAVDVRAIHLKTGGSCFLPERWLSKGFSSSTPFYGFSMGSHACFGRHLALMEVKMIIGSILNHYEVSVPDGYEFKTSVKVE